MNYAQIYNDLITKYKSLNVKGEKHHIKPRSLGGSDDNTNLVELPYKAHVLAHHLLTKMYTGKAKRKMIYAYFMMRTGGKRKNIYKRPITANEYEAFRAQLSEEMTQNNPMKNPKSVAKMVQTRKANGTDWARKPPDFGERVSARMMGNKNASGPKTEEHKKNISKAHMGILHTAETKDKIRGLAKKQHQTNRVCSLRNRKEYATAVFLGLVARGLM